MPAKEGIAWVVSVDMGYGHQRAAYPLKDIAFERILTANSDKMISLEEKKLWENSRGFYEFISRFKNAPIVGKPAFALFNMTLKIPPLYPFRDLSMPDLGALSFRRLIKKGLCRSLLDYMKRNDLPIIATHPFPALAAHYAGIKNNYCVITDTDIARGWICDEPRKNTTTYFASCLQAAVRLREYGISEEKIIMTGFPLPKENIGGENLSILKADLAERLVNLDPNRVFVKKYRESIEKRLGKLEKKKNRALSITYLVGGAGAESDIGIRMIRSLSEKIMKREVTINLSAGTRMDVLSYYTKELERIRMKNEMGSSINIIFALTKRDYFQALNLTLRKTDIIWTKPSEMSFYTALGLPVIMAPPIGAQEIANMNWLMHIGSGSLQENPDFANDWLFYWLEQGRLAEAAWKGFLDAPVLGAYAIEKIIKKHRDDLAKEMRVVPN